MWKIIKTECWKIKRYSVIKAGIIMMSLSVLLSLFYSTATGPNTPVWTFVYYMEQILISNCTMFFPMVITLVAGYMITREQTDDTLKSILTVPISFRRILAAKLVVLLILTVLFSLVSGVLGIAVEGAAGFPGFSFSDAVLWLIRIVFANILIYVAVLPVIILTSSNPGGFVAGVALAFVYGYGGTFEGSFMNYYPIKAAMILADPQCGAEYDMSYQVFPAILSLLIVLAVSGLLVVTKKRIPQRRTAVSRKKKKAYKRGW